MEIERKFLIKNLPENINSYDHAELSQSFLDFGDNDSLEQRIREIKNSKGTRYFFTEKGKGDLVRTENEKEISREEFLEFSKKVISSKVEKTRYFIPLKDGLKIELDIYKGKLSGLITAEIEFKSEEDAKHFEVPKWFDKEITYDKKFKNKNLSRIM